MTSRGSGPGRSRAGGTGEGGADAAGGYHPSAPRRLWDAVARLVDARAGWHRLPTAPGLVVLIGLRDLYRRHNLHDTSRLPATDLPPLGPYEPRFATERTADGTYNDLDDPRMGMAGARFGRNVPVGHTAPEPRPDVLEPSPREVSRRLMTRREFVPAESANALVAAWLQFMVRDWFSHGESPRDDPWEVELLADDPWYERPMRILRTPPDPTRPGGDGRPPTYVNTHSHWWDGSQVYGNSLAEQRALRTGEGGRLHVRPGGLPALPADPERNPALVPGFWLGLVLMQALFAHEHNAVADHLARAYPTWSDEQVFQRARLVNAALLAKIHTVEWTPAVISHPTTVTALRANWFGLAGERVARRFGRVSRSEVVSGIPGSATRHYGVPYALTEEFVAVYRMHPLVPDDYVLRSAGDDGVLLECGFRDLAGPNALQVVEKVGMADLLYSFGRAHPGLVTLRNFPRFLQDFERPNGGYQDLAATDVLRTRELGVPRYNDFRRLLGLAPAGTFEDLSDDPETVRDLRDVYGDVERVDTVVGMYAETRPQGFAFSDTAFRVFVVMASRRLNSDRFFTRDYRPEVYSPEGLRWVAENGFREVLLRHHPGLAAALDGVANPFAPWVRAGRD
jgi:hypothetical protein